LIFRTQIAGYNVTDRLFTLWSAGRFVGLSVDKSVDICRLAVFRLGEDKLFDAYSSHLLDMTTSGAFISTVVSSYKYRFTLRPIFSVYRELRIGRIAYGHTEAFETQT
jgi:hypothetical protein